ncbi:MAG: hypothetical protein RR365_12735 [Bacteroides sp.]
MKFLVRHMVWLLVNLLFALPLYAQSSFQQEFDRKRQMMLDEFEDFRRKANMEYLNFLTQAWIQMGVEPEVKRDFKPVVEPIVASRPAESSFCLESGKIETLERAGEGGASQVQDEIEQLKESVAATGSLITVRFYGASLQYNSSGLSAVVPCPLKDEKMAVKMWKEFAGCPLAGLLKQLLETRRQLALNDWAFYLLVEQVSHSMFDPCYEDMATVFRHFLLVQFGYDVRMARQGNEIVLLVPFKEKVFARSFVKINAASYYVYCKRPVAETSLLTYEIPADKVQGDLLSLVYSTPLNFPADRMKECRVGEHTDCPVKVKLNSHLVDFYRDYPQMEVKNYPAVAVDKTFTASLLKSFAEYLKGKTPDEQLSALLKWTQSSFEYIRDEVQFGREKPFFVEENFFYPGNDCEDRAILFSYLVWHLLQIDVVLVEYEGHVATAVAIEGKGDYFLLQGKKFLVCDPTYIHAGIGQSMPKYKKEKAKILLVSKLWII